MTELSSLTDALAEKVKNRQRPENLLPDSNKPAAPVCPKCRGLGFLRKDLPVGHPEFGKVIPCDCQGIEVYAIPSGLTAKEIDTLTWDSVYSEGNALAAVAEARKIIERGYGMLYLWGGPGKAKTLILQIAVAQAVQAKKRAEYISMSAILDNLREAYDAEYPNMESVSRLRRWTNVPLLAIDEFDKVKGTEYVSERQMRLIDERYTAAIREQPVITLVASNVSPNESPDYLADRFNDGRCSVIQLTGESMRPGMSWQHDI